MRVIIDTENNIIEIPIGEVIQVKELYDFLDSVEDSENWTIKAQQWNHPIMPYVPVTIKGPEPIIPNDYPWIGTPVMYKTFTSEVK